MHVLPATLGDSAFLFADDVKMTFPKFKQTAFSPLFLLPVPGAKYSIPLVNCVRDLRVPVNTTFTSSVH